MKPVYDARPHDADKVLPLSQLLSLTADAVAGVQSGRSLTDLLASLPHAARPGVQALTFHVLRWWGGAQTVRRALAPKTPPPNVDALLCTALALMWPPALASKSGPVYADHTLVDQSVQAARQRTPQAASFINAVLRRFLRERDAVVATALQQPLATWNHPTWWVQAVEQDWPLSWPQVLHAANQRPPMTLRVNVQRVSPTAYLQRLCEAGLSGRAWPDPSSGTACIVLETPCPVSRLPGFDQGDVSVQDAAAQRAALLLCDATTSASPLPAGARVLDACAAPGGKTAHLLEHRPDLEVVALDADVARLERVKETLERLHLVDRPTGPPPLCQAADARDTATWWDGRPFEAILLDAPCSASGIVRRHPDVRWLRRPQDLVALARTQSALLEALWPMLRPGGRLLYATCSVFRDEGDRQIDAFLQRLGPSQARLDPLSPGHLLPLGEIPIDNQPQSAAVAAPLSADGFYYALIHKA